jgi:hypothetical protein
VLDVTIAYPGGTPTMLDLLGGRIPEVVIEVRELPIPPEVPGSRYEEDNAARVRYQRWVHEIWADKDARLVRILDGKSEAPA